MAIPTEELNSMVVDIVNGVPKEQSKYGNLTPLHSEVWDNMANEKLPPGAEVVIPDIDWP